MNLKRILSFFKSKLFFVGLMIIAQLLVLVVLIAMSVFSSFIAVAWLG